MKRKIILTTSLSIAFAAIVSLILILSLGGRCNHSLVEVNAKEPTCTEEGYGTYLLCERCGYNTKEYKAPLGHKTSATYAKEPSCTESGHKAYISCERCDYTTYEEIAPKGHSLSACEANESTCTEPGNEKYEVCAWCDYTTYKDIAALGHDLLRHDKKSATCTDAGHEAFEDCKRCDYTTYVEIPATGEHVWDGGTVTHPATCSSEGERTHYCTVCKEASLVLPVEKEDHSFDETWSFDSISHYKICTCGERSEVAEHFTTAPSDEFERCDVCRYIIKGESGIRFATLEKQNDVLYAAVSGGLESFSFADEISVIGEAAYEVWLDAACTRPLKSSTLTLEVGENTVYILEFIDGEEAALYKVIIYRKATYLVKFDTCGGTSVPDAYVEEGCTVISPDTERAGYTLAGWSHDLSMPITESLTVKAIWEAKRDTEYTVRLYFEDESGEYRLADENTLTGVTDTEISLDPLPYSGYTVNYGMSDLTGNIAGNGSLILNIYYSIERFSVTVKTSGATVTGSGVYLYGSEISLVAVPNAGYYIDGWYINGHRVSGDATLAVTVTKDVEIELLTKPSQSTPYTIEYYTERLNGTYELTASLSLYGTTDTEVSAEILVPDHFYLNSEKSLTAGKIRGDGNLTLEVYYSRRIYTVRVTGESSIATGGGEYAYGRTVTLSATAAAGYTFGGWYMGEDLFSSDDIITFTAERDLELVAVSAAKSDTPYTVRHYAANLSGGYDLITTEELCGYTDSAVSATFLDMEHFLLNEGKSVTHGSIHGDGSLVLSLYYERVVYKIYLSSAEGGMLSSLYGEYAYGSEVKMEASALPGYAFHGWYMNGKLLSSDSSYSITADSDIFIFADVQPLPEMEQFIFTSSVNQCIVLGLKDEPVSVIIPDYVTAIGNEAFKGHTRLYSVTLGRGLVSIGEAAFADCIRLCEVINHSRLLPSAGDDGLGGVALYAYEVHSDVTRVCFEDDFVFYRSEAQYLVDHLGDERIITLPNGEYYVGAYAFRDNLDLLSITLPEALLGIFDGAFAGCHRLCEVINCSSLEITAGDGAHGAVAANSVAVHTNESRISLADGFWFYRHEDEVYLLCPEKAEEEYILPDNFCGLNYSVRAYAFCGIGDLARVVLPDKILAIGKDAFLGCDSLNLSEYGGFYYLGDKDNQYKAMILAKDTDTYALHNATELVADGAMSGRSIRKISLPISMLEYIPKEELVEVEITDGNVLYAGAFSGCTMLTKLILCDGISTVSKTAFEGCAVLVYNEYRDGLYLGSLNNPYLVLVSLKDPEAKEIFIHENTLVAVEDCLSGAIPEGLNIPLALLSLINKTELRRLNLLGKGELYADALSECKSLATLVLPVGLEVISHRALDGCPLLQDVYYEGCVEDFADVYVSPDNSGLDSAEIFFYSDDEPETIGNYWKYDDGAIAVWAEYLIKFEKACYSVLLEDAVVHYVFTVRLNEEVSLLDFYLGAKRLPINAATVKKDGNDLIYTVIFDTVVGDMHLEREMSITYKLQGRTRRHYYGKACALEYADRVISEELVDFAKADHFFVYVRLAYEINKNNHDVVAIYDEFIIKHTSIEYPEVFPDGGLNTPTDAESKKLMTVMLKDVRIEINEDTTVNITLTFKTTAEIYSECGENIRYSHGKILDGDNNPLAYTDSPLEISVTGAPLSVLYDDIYFVIGVKKDGEYTARYTLGAYINRLEEKGEDSDVYKALYDILDYTECNNASPTLYLN